LTCAVGSGAAGCSASFSPGFWVVFGGTGLAGAKAPAVGFGAVFLTTGLGVARAALAAGEPLASGFAAGFGDRSGGVVAVVVFRAAVFLDVVGFFAIARNLRGLLASNVCAGFGACG